MSYKPTLVALSEAVAEWFPELEGRAFPVSEVDPFNNKTSVPTLPVAVVALVGEANGQATGSGSSRIEIQDDVLVQFIFKPVKYQREDGQDSPFFAFYDYENIRDRFILGLRQWRTPRGGSVTFNTLDVESDEFAVYIALRLRTSENWCPPPAEETCEPQPVPVVDIAFKVYPDKGCCPEPDCPDPVDPCDEARERNPHGINDKPYDWKGYD